MLKVAIIGMGTVASIYKNIIDASSNAQLVAVCDIDPDKKSLAPKTNFYTNINEILEKENLDCVHICLPHNLHKEAVLACAKKKVNILVEKPVALNYEEATTFMDVEQKYDVKVAVCFQNRFNNTVVALKELIAEIPKEEFVGSKGIVTWHRDMSYYSGALWRGMIKEAGGGVMINQSIHMLDLLSYLGGYFESVQAKLSNFTLPETEIEDSVMAYFQYQNRDATSIYFSTIGYCTNSSVMLEMVFKNKTYRIQDNHLIVITPSEEPKVICSDQTLAGSKHYYGASHGTLIESFYKDIINDTHHYVTVKEAAYSLKLIESVVKSDSMNAPIIISHS